MPAAAEASADPIFAAIEAFHRADAEYMLHEGPDDIPDELGDRQWNAYKAVIRTRPTTPAGLVALITVARERADWYDANGTENGKENCTALAAIDEAAKALIGRLA